MKKRWNARLETGRWVFGSTRKPRLFWWFHFWRRDLRHLFVSGSWYCQIQTTWLIMFFSYFLPTSHLHIRLIDCLTTINKQYFSGFPYPYRTIFNIVLHTNPPLPPTIISSARWTEGGENGWGRGGGSDGEID